MGNDVNHAAHRPGAVDRRTRPADILDALHQRNRDLIEVRIIGNAWAAHGNAIHQHQHLFRFRPANKEGRGLPAATILRNIHARQAAHHIIQIFGLPAIDIITGDDIGRCEHGIDGLLKTVGGNNHSIISGCILRPARKCRDGNRRQQRSFFYHC